MPNQLYFVAIIPPPSLREEIHELKLEVKEKFNSSHSLNAPPHITLLSPFRVAEGKESELNSKLSAFTKQFDSFKITFNNFSTFPPRVVFIDVKENAKLINIQSELEDLARSNSDLFNYKYDDRPYHPHLTLAFKDLTKKDFHKAWKEFKDRTFEASFKAEALSLLKHNGEKWELTNKFKL